MKQKNKIIDLYKKAWENHDITLLDKIFTDDIIYEEKPDNIFQGLKEVTKYWKENSQKQKNLVFLPTRIIIIDYEYIVEWEAEFYHLIKKKYIHLYGSMFLKIRNNMICHLKEYFFLFQK